MKVEVVNGAPRMGRSLRAPEHPFNLRVQPWAITPFCIIPVLPGDTMKNLTLQARVVSDPLKSKLVGWWAETYLFYVKHRDLQTDWAALKAMHLTNASTAALQAGAQSWATYVHRGGIDWVSKCLQRVTEEYFRNEGEAWNTNLIGSYPAASTNRDDSWLDSLVDNTVAPPAENIYQDGGGSDDTVLTAFQNQFDRMRQMRATDMSYADWLATFGERVPDAEDNETEFRPELLRYTRQFTYPTNTVEPTTGVASSAAVFSVAERADKDRRFKEPGFIFGVMCVRPKVYLNKQVGAAVGSLREARLWLPALLRDEPYLSIAQFASGATPDGPLGANPTNGYWADLRDLFIRGDQFVNYDITAAAAADANPVALPTAALVTRYATAAMADGLFAGAAPANQIRVDGIVKPHILGAVGPDQT